jgi:3-oxoacyl-[acyl-carrier protein] reductase
MDLGLSNRVYVVTGGSRGLGRAGAEALVADGAQVVISGRDEATVTATQQSLGGSDHALGLAGDLADPEHTGRLIATAVARYGKCDGALISVGGPTPGTVLNTPEDAWRAAFETVFLGALRVARAVADSAESGGSIAFVLSTSVRSPLSGLAISGGLRPGLAMTAKSLADELGPRGIRVNGLLPGRFDTERTKELDATGGRAVSTRREQEKAIPLGRYGEPAEFGKVAAFVLSPAASFINGAMIPIDGGALRAL